MCKMENIWRFLSLHWSCLFFLLLNHRGRAEVISTPNGRCDTSVSSYSPCILCPLNRHYQCPPGSTQTTTGEGLNNCYLRIGAFNVRSCRHTCLTTTKKCCQNYWGTDCLACPNDRGLACGGVGTCSDSLSGNGTCSCQAAFSGTACEKCMDAKKYGDNCNQNCTCVHGICDNSRNSTGKCKPEYNCDQGWTGQNCDISIVSGCDPSCLQQNHSVCVLDNGQKKCICQNGYSGDGVNCQENKPCQDLSLCSSTGSACSHKGPGLYECLCQTGYQGDGTICQAIDPCQINNGGCGLSNTTKCTYTKPGNRTCSCLSGFDSSIDGDECQLIDLCLSSPSSECGINGQCFMKAPGLKGCQCKPGYVGDGVTCYGNIIERVKELHIKADSPVHGNLSMASVILAHSHASPIAVHKPLTFFVSVDSGFAKLTEEQKNKLVDVDFASHTVRCHLLAIELDSNQFPSSSFQVTTLQGVNATISKEESDWFIAVGSVKAKIIVKDQVASNGIIHIIDNVLWPGEIRNTANMNMSMIIKTTPELSLFRDIIQETGFEAMLSSSIVYTLFAPTNSSFENLYHDELSFLRSSEGRTKLEQIIKHHFVFTKWDIFDLISQQSLTTYQEEQLNIKLMPMGQLVVGGNARVVQTNIASSSGVIHMIDNFVIPASVYPILNKFCPKNINQTAYGRCYSCAINFPGGICPAGYSALASREQCVYAIDIYGMKYYYRGCKTVCQREVEVPECCSGYYGASCFMCPGKHENPCNGHGKCDDLIGGQGVCQCDDNFQGTACELCTDSTMFGPNCNQTCTCQHGVCDNGPQGMGQCVKDLSCNNGTTGDNCDKQLQLCGSNNCHVDALCVLRNATISCECKQGYEGGGDTCKPINPCNSPSQGSCHQSAVCVYLGPGNHTCNCMEGWTGDGKYCQPINNCLLPNHGNCHTHSGCIYVAPGKSSCQCNTGYTGDGFTCFEINTCLINNGGCAPQAECSRTGPGEHNCTCKASQGYIGNGYTCYGTVASNILEHSQLRYLASQLNIFQVRQFFTNPLLNATLFAPSDAAFDSIPEEVRDKWINVPDHLMYLLKYHSLNGSYSSTVLKSVSSLPTYLNTWRLSFETAQNGMLKVDNATVQYPDIPSSNGIIHVIDKVLIPPDGVLPPLAPPKPYLLNLLSNKTQYTQFVDFIKKFNISEDLLNNCTSQCTIFAPTNDAFNNLPDILHNNLNQQDIYGHIISREIPSNSLQAGMGEQMSSWRGFRYLVNVYKERGSGKFLVNGIDIIDPDMQANEGIVHGIARVIKNENNRCDTRKTRYVRSHCSPCYRLPDCPTGFTLTTVISNAAGCFFFHCKIYCHRIDTVKKCCDGFWGTDCQACPGGVGNTCSKHGACSSGIAGTGHCNCSTQFTGTACENCLEGFYGANCTQKCDCQNGLCDDNLQGTGRCTCFKNWKGPKCSQNVSDVECNGTCHQHASCRGSPAHCSCDAGYTGNGTVCSAINPCNSNNGGCSANAKCVYNSPGNHSCLCNKLYTGDGTICIEMDPCQEQNGGCDVNANCIKTSFGRRICSCSYGFTGNGVTCNMIDLCEKNNGGCSYLGGKCSMTGPLERKCECMTGFVGNGLECFDSVLNQLLMNPSTQVFGQKVKESVLSNLIGSQSSVYTLMAPDNDAFKQKFPSRKRRSTSPLSDLDRYMMYHTIGCIRLTSESLWKNATYTSALGYPVSLLFINHKLYFQGGSQRANVTKILPSFNGIALVLDKFIDPPAPPTNTNSSSLLSATSQHGYKTFNSLLRKVSGLNAILTKSSPSLMFWPTDEAFASLPAVLRNKILDSDPVLRKIILQYHISSHKAYRTMSFLNRPGGIYVDTLQGTSLLVSCHNGKGDLYIDGYGKVTDREILFYYGRAYGVDKVLFPPVSVGRCDLNTEISSKTSCSSCSSPLSCPSDTTHQSLDKNNCTYEGNLVGCQVICEKQIRKVQCCPFFYGPDCQACPGGYQDACSQHGVCNQGIDGNGTCSCSAGYEGFACEKCINNATCTGSANCTINNGGCDVHADCSFSTQVVCQCRNGFTGDGLVCSPIDVCVTGDDECHANALCKYRGPGLHECICKTGYSGDGIVCVKLPPPPPPCAKNNGGCSKYATCSEKDDKAVCKCRSGYEGDGKECYGNLIQVIGDHPEISTFYKDLVTSSSVEEVQLVETLQLKTAKFPAILAPLDSSPIPKVVRFKDIQRHIIEDLTIQTKNIKEGHKTFEYTLNGHMIKFMKTNNQVVLNDGIARVVEVLQATNGLIYVIDHYIPPFIGPTHRPGTTPPHSKPTVKPTSKPTLGPHPTNTSNHHPKAATDTKGSGAATIIVVVIALVAFIVVVILTVVCCRKKRMVPGVAYTKSEDAVHFESEPYSDDDISSFANPMYDNQTGSLSDVSETSSTKQFENPAYGVALSEQKLHLVGDEEASGTNQGSSSFGKKWYIKPYSKSRRGTPGQRGSKRRSQNDYLALTLEINAAHH